MEEPNRTVHYSKKPVDEELAAELRRRGTRRGSLRAEDGAHAKAFANENNKKVYTKQDSSYITDIEFLNFVDSVSKMKDKNAISKRKHPLGKISETHAKIVKEILSSELGVEIDVDNYTVNIDGSAIKHIEEKHGANGSSDHSMQSQEDVARVGWAANNAESGYIARTQSGKIDYSTQYKNADGTPSPKIILEKLISDGKFIVVECVPDTVAKKYILLVHEK